MATRLQREHQSIAEAVLSKGNRFVRALSGPSQQDSEAVKRTAQKDIAI